MVSAGCNIIFRRCVLARASTTFPCDCDQVMDCAPGLFVSASMRWA